MRLVRTPLRLHADERQAIEELRGDRGLNVCLRRAVQMWIRHERALLAGHATALHGPQSIDRYSDPTIVRAAPDVPQIYGPPPGGPSDASPVTPRDPAEFESGPEEEPPRRRRPPPAGTWGAPRP